ncbi:MAG: hypothetical protein ACRDM7_01195, partial [Thermoleophilaceae bacterium]
MILLVRVSVPLPAALDLGRLAFWAAITLAAAAFPVRLPGGVVVHTTTAPLIAAVFDPGLTNPFSVCWVAFLGTLELRDIRRELPWYGTLYNRSAYTLSAYAAWLAASAAGPAIRPGDPLGIIAQFALAGTAFHAVNLTLAVMVASRRTKTPVARVWMLSISNVLTSLIGLVPLGWLMAEVANRVGLWAAFLFMVPLHLA